MRRLRSPEMERIARHPAASLAVHHVHFGQGASYWCKSADSDRWRLESDRERHNAPQRPV